MRFGGGGLRALGCLLPVMMGMGTSDVPMDPISRGSGGVAGCGRGRVVTRRLRRRTVSPILGAVGPLLQAGIRAARLLHRAMLTGSFIPVNLAFLSHSSLSALRLCLLPPYWRRT